MRLRRGFTLAGWLLALLGFTLACSLSNFGLSASPTPAPSPAPTVNVVDDLDYEYEYWTFLIPGLYHLYGVYPKLDDLVTVRYTNYAPVPVRVKAEAQVETYTDWAAKTVTVEPRQTVEVNLHPVLQPEAIERLASYKEANLRIRITLLAPEETVLEDSTDMITVYARRDFPWNLYEIVDDLTLDENELLLAAWVTPNDPAVEEWIRVAADYHPQGLMPSGYDYDVWDRLEALWDALDDVYEVTYVSTTVNMGDLVQDGLHFQRIRFPAEVLHQESANCIETTLLWASAAEALRLHPYVVDIPGHAYVAIDSVPDGSKAYFIETTLIGRGSFSDAVDVGGDEWEEDQPYIEAGDEDYHLVDILEARDKGILPMPWH